MRNPPWALPLAYPLGFVPERLGALPSSLLLLGSLIISVRTLSRTLGSDKRSYHDPGFLPSTSADFRNNGPNISPSASRFGVVSCSA